MNEDYVSGDARQLACYCGQPPSTCSSCSGSRFTVGVGTVSSQNQCDGCMQGAPLRGHLHIDKDDHAFMVCQRERY